MKRKMLFVGTVVSEDVFELVVDFGDTRFEGVPKSAISRQSKSRRKKP